ESVVIVTAGHPATAVIAKPTYSIEACHAALESIEQSYAATDLAGAIAKATDIAREDAKQPNKFLYIISDGTRSAFEGGQAGALKLSEGSPPVLLPNQALRVGGRHVITASLMGGDDRLVVDNTRSRVVNVASEIKVLIVDGERSSQGLAGSGAFLELALAPVK